MTEQFLSEEQLSTFYRRFSLIPNVEDQEETIRKVIYKSKISMDEVLMFKDLPGFTTNVFSCHPFLPISIVKLFPEMFSLETFLESSTNVSLIMNLEFREMFSLTDSVICKFVERQKKVSDRVFQNIDVDNESLEVVSALILKTEINGNTFVKDNLERCKKRFGENIFTINVIKSGKFECEAEFVRKALEKEPITTRSIAVALRALREYPADFLKVIEYLEETVQPEVREFEPSEDFIFLLDPLIGPDNASRVLQVLSRISEKPVDDLFLYKFLKSCNDENALMRITELLIKYFGEENIILVAREKKFETLLFQLAFLTERK